MKNLFCLFLSLISLSSFAQKGNDGTYLFPIEKGGRYGYINQKGDIIIPTVYDGADYFYEGLASVKIKNKYGFINPSNTVVIEPDYDTTRHFQEGLCAVGTFGNNMPPQWGYIDKSGTLIETELPALGFAANFYNGRALVALNGMDEYRIINKAGKIAAKTGDYYFFEDPDIHYSDGLLRVQKVTGVGIYYTEFIDTLGKVYDKIQYQDYEDIGNVNEGMISVKKDEKYGFIDINGNVIVPTEYDTVVDFSEGMARVSKMMEPNHLTLKLEGGKHGYVDKKGTLVIEMGPNMGYCFHNGYAKVFDSGKWGFMNTNGTMVMPAEYEDVKDFFRGLAYVKKDGHWQYINTKGEVVWQQSE